EQVKAARPAPSAILAPADIDAPEAQESDVRAGAVERRELCQRLDLGVETAVVGHRRRDAVGLERMKITPGCARRRAVLHLAASKERDCARCEARLVQPLFPARGEQREVFSKEATARQLGRSMKHALVLRAVAHSRADGVVL